LNSAVPKKHTNFNINIKKKTSRNYSPSPMRDTNAKTKVRLQNNFKKVKEIEDTVDPESHDDRDSVIDF